MPIERIWLQEHDRREREKTIDEFVEELKEYGVLVILTHKEIDRLAEQLKEGGKDA